MQEERAKGAHSYERMFKNPGEHGAGVSSVKTPLGFLRVSSLSAREGLSKGRSSLHADQDASEGSVERRVVNKARISLRARTSKIRAPSAAYGQNPKPIKGRMLHIGHVNGTGADMVSCSEAFSHGRISLVSRPRRTRSQAIPEDARYWRAGEGYRQTHASRGVLSDDFVHFFTGSATR